MNKMTGRRRLARRESGIVAIQVALFLMTLLCCAALAIDLGRWVVVRHELQNAADAAALAGARVLPGQLVASAVPATWTAATTAANTAATQIASANTANGNTNPASAQTVLVGYWDVANVPSPVPASLSQTITSPTDKPAVLVTVGLNGGSNLPLTLGAMFGITSVRASATAVAIISAPGTALPKALFPIALNQCIYKNPAYWSNGQPVTTQEFAIGDGGPSNCTGTAAQWTSLTLGSNPSAYGPCSQNSPNSVTAIDCLMSYGNGPSLSVSDNITIQPGVEASMYNNFPLTPPLQVTLPVVQDGPNMTSTGNGGDMPIVGFAAFQVDYVIGANGKSTPKCTTDPACLNPPCTKGVKCVIGHLIAGKAGSTTAGGTTSTYFGAVTPPSLAALPSSAWY